MEKIWNFIQTGQDTVDELTRQIGCHPVTAKLLNNRSVFNPKDANHFFYPLLQNLSPPFQLKDIDRAVTRIADALKEKQKILIFGDYDVDGVTSTFLLWQFLRSVNAEVVYYIPDRITEGYGLKPAHIDPYAVSKQIKLIITVDCGSMSHDAVSAAQKQSIDIIVTDHHEPPDTLPPAVALVNPKRSDSPRILRNLSGVGVAFYLVVCLRKKLRELGFWQNRPEPNLKSLCDLVALGTIADMVPLTGDNRILVQTGIEILRSGENEGVKALMRVCDIDTRHADSGDVMYQLAPRLNAAGRIEHADAAISLLTSKNADQADVSAQHLDNLNKRRREMEKNILMDIDRILDQYPQRAKGGVIVLSSPDWHVGILGIIASRLVNRFARPVVILAQEGDTAKGSARSVPGLDLYCLLSACSNHLITFGGHAMAAGIQIKVEQIDSFRQNLEQSVARITEHHPFSPELLIDCRLSFDNISPALMNEIENFKPFGEGNPEPLFMAENVRVKTSKILNGGHRRMSLSQAGSGNGRVFQAIQFNPDPGNVKTDFFNKIAYRLQWNRWNGRKNLQIVVEDVKV